MFEGWKSPFEAENRREQDTHAAWSALRENPEAAALMAGLSMLANNNGRNTLGQLVGTAGMDALNGLTALEHQRLARQRVEQAARARQNATTAAPLLSAADAVPDELTSGSVSEVEVDVDAPSAPNGGKTFSGRAVRRVRLPYAFTKKQRAGRR